MMLQDISNVKSPTEKCFGLANLCLYFLRTKRESQRTPAGHEWLIGHMFGTPAHHIQIFNLL